ncbi:MAG: transglycosylase SLT domain-containing protein [Tannerella sp.]|jgi:membrane-bound lytic murein transglycosylase F|nr:transglycosylase SLT domain-containing protein [Tannerella sp.]
MTPKCAHILSGIAIFCLFTCHHKTQQNEERTYDFPELVAHGEITAATLNSSVSYFRYKGQPMGYEYELIADFARTHGLHLNIKIAENISQLIEILQNGGADVVAYPVKIDNLAKEDVLFCGHEQQSSLVIVQHASHGDTLLTDVTQLIGKAIYVKPDTRYHERLENLNRELGGGIRIMDIAEDTVTTEDLIGMVSRREIPYTVCEDNIARLNQTYYRNINIGLEISFKQRSSWVVRKSAPLLAEAINKWASDNAGEKTYKTASKRYFELSKYPVDLKPQIIDGQISPYDHFFKQYAPLLGWDWQLLASVSWQESHFDPSAMAWSGARGLMGIMPETAAHLGFELPEMDEPEKNIQAGVECLRRFGRRFVNVPDSLERIKLTLASYNAGLGHILDAQQLAEKYGRDPDVWSGSVNEFVRLKSEPKYYADSICKYGYLRGAETYNYVTEVFERYEYYKQETARTVAGKVRP